MALKKFLHTLRKFEVIALGFLVLILGFSGYRISQAFYLENTDIQFVQGGSYVEGYQGEVQTLNPLFAQQGSPSQDLTALIFSGLTRYDTRSGEVIPDMAEVQISEDGTVYTFSLKDNITWHDGEPLTADDVLFTYNDVLKHPEFTGTILGYNDYSALVVEKVDDLTIQFTLEEPDGFFLSKTTTAILPKHLLENEPVSALDKILFNQQPIGSGPYRYVSVSDFPTYREYTLELYDGYYGTLPHIQTLFFRTFLTEEDLLSNIDELNAIRTLSDDLLPKIQADERFTVETYQLPQYIALFMNSDSSKLSEPDVRLGLQLGTDKDAILSAIGEDVRIDTPFLEMSQADWTQRYDVGSANGALFDTDWKLPNKELVDVEEDEGDDVEISEDEDESESGSNEESTSEVTYIDAPNEGEDLDTALEPVTLAGTLPVGTTAVWVNDYQLLKFEPGDQRWEYIASKEFDSIEEGQNVYDIYAETDLEDKQLIDTITINFEPKEFLDDQEEEEKTQEIEAENLAAVGLPVRENANGDTLTLRLVTSQSPPEYAQVAEMIQSQWEKLGVAVQIEVLDNVVLQERVKVRDYDVLLFGQNLGYNLDAFPYWHSSQAGENGLNLSQFKNFVADSLLENARSDSEQDRQETLSELQVIINEQTPAIFLYSPTYYTAFSNDVMYTELTHLSTTSDRLANIQQWYSNVSRNFDEKVGVATFMNWLGNQFKL